MSDYQEMYESDADEQGVMNGVVPPHSLMAEQSVLGGLLLENSSYDQIADVVGIDDFYRHEHRIIFRVLVKLINEGRPADVITVQEALQLSEELEAAGGFDYLIKLAQDTPSAANIRRYAELIRERSVMRQLAEVGTSIARDAYNPQGRDVKELLDDAEKRVFQISESTSQGRRDFADMKELIGEVLDKITTLADRENLDEVTGVATGFRDLDKKTSGLQAGDLIIVAGRPSMGKTAFSINIAEYVATEKNLPVAVFSMEMGGAQLVMRMIGSLGLIDQHNLKTGKLAYNDWESLQTTINKLSEAPIYIDETAALTALEVRARARRLARKVKDRKDKNGNEGKLGLIVIDYLQLMSGSGRKNDNRTAELGEISRSLKALAKELEVPIIALSQLSRSVESRNDKRPMMSDLRESGAIEQDADLIMFMYRDEYYNQESPYKGLAECILAKHRNGSVGKIILTWRGQYTKFSDAAHDMIPDALMVED